MCEHQTRRLFLVGLALCVLPGCGEDYPQVSYPANNPYFQTPDLVIDLPPISYLDDQRVDFPGVIVPRPSAGLVVRGTLSHPLTEEERYQKSLGIAVLRADGQATCLQLGFPVTDKGDLPSYELHITGPARPGDYTLTIQTYEWDYESNTSLNLQRGAGALKVLDGVQSAAD